MYLASRKYFQINQTSIAYCHSCIEVGVKCVHDKVHFCEYIFRLRNGQNKNEMQNCEQQKYQNQLILATLKVAKLLAFLKIQSNKDISNS